MKPNFIKINKNTWIDANRIIEIKVYKESNSDLDYIEIEVDTTSTIKVYQISKFKLTTIDEQVNNLIADINS